MLGPKKVCTRAYLIGAHHQVLFEELQLAGSAGVLFQTAVPILIGAHYHPAVQYFVDQLASQLHHPPAVPADLTAAPPAVLAAAGQYHQELPLPGQSAGYLYMEEGEG